VQHTLRQAAQQLPNTECNKSN